MDRSSDAPEARPLSFLGAAGFSLAVVLLLQLSLSITEAAHPGAVTDLVSVGTCNLLAHAIALFAIMRFYEPSGSIRNVLALRRAPLFALLLAAVVGAGLAPGASWLSTLVQHRFPPSAEETELVEKLFSTATIGRRVSLFVVLVFVMPACDELLFRGALFTLLKRGRRAEIVVVATSAYHVFTGGMNPRGILATLVMAIALGWIRAVTGSVLPALACSMVFFGMEVVPVSLGWEEPAWRLPIVFAGIGAALVAVVGIALISRRSACVTDARLADR
ncbi:MAG: CPBP family intramembrane metalloprotease [Polyangiaceae bacterium]|nr:CPBP family intramembrane metalloprotease [Polyangiaceae bacterium]